MAGQSDWTFIVPTSKGRQLMLRRYFARLLLLNLASLNPAIDGKRQRLRQNFLDGPSVLLLLVGQTDLNSVGSRHQLMLRRCFARKSSIDLVSSACYELYTCDPLLFRRNKNRVRGSRHSRRNGEWIG